MKQSKIRKGSSTIKIESMMMMNIAFDGNEVKIYDPKSVRSNSNGYRITKAHDQ